uniref:Uncharacterized protein n=1 Tax=Anopheles christyi TaxID=43041 RepID=A0A3F2YTW2_9DIPT
MKNSFHLVALLVAVQFTLMSAFLIPVGKKLEFVSKVSSIQVSHVIHQPKSVVNQSFDLEINITRPIKELKLQFSYYLTDEGDAIQTTIIKRTVDVCFYIRNPKSDRVVKQMYDYLLERTNIKMQCPIAPGNYYMRNIRPADVPLPGFLPESHLMFETLYRSEVRRVTMVEFRYFAKMVRYFENIF